MNKLEHLDACKKLIKKVLKHRRGLIRRNQNRLPDSVEMARTIAELEFQSATIRSFDQMMGWINQQGTRNRVFRLITPNNKAWRDEYDRLVYLGQVLQGKIVKAKQLELTNK
jgi:hypothetical protein